MQMRGVFTYTRLSAAINNRDSVIALEADNQVVFPDNVVYDSAVSGSPASVPRINLPAALSESIWGRFFCSREIFSAENVPFSCVFCVLFNDWTAPHCANEVMFTRTLLITRSIFFMINSFSTYALTAMPNR